MLITVKEYFCPGFPTISDIKEAYDIVRNEKCLVVLIWSVLYSGSHRVTISEELASEVTPEEYFERYIPKEYGV